MDSHTTLDDLYRAFREAVTRGKTPSPEEFCRDCPELLDGLRRLIAAGAAPAYFPLTQTSAPPEVGARTLPEPPRATGPCTGAEPVPGYALERQLGKGGFGEVWQASAPGGFRVAFKFVSLSGRAAEIERRALEVLKSLRHPNLLTIFGTWQTDDWLIIGMELADRTLHDLLQEATRRGAAGIEYRSLARYALETAKVIDYLNKPRHFLGGSKPVGVQHGDIKPQNILLLGEGVKVGDFGLLRVLEKVLDRHVGGMTPLYAAPEVFEGRISRWSDQYSLAVTWCQLRGGRLPFTGTAGEIVEAHRSRPPDLTMLPQDERPVIEKALAKEPRRRWPDCRAFVRALTEAVRSGRSVSEREGTVPPPGEAKRTMDRGTDLTTRPRSTRQVAATATSPRLRPLSPTRALAVLTVLSLLAVFILFTSWPRPGSEAYSPHRPRETADGNPVQVSHVGKPAPLPNEAARICRVLGAGIAGPLQASAVLQGPDPPSLPVLMALRATWPSGVIGVSAAGPLHAAAFLFPEPDEPLDLLPATIEELLQAGRVFAASSAGPLQAAVVVHVEVETLWPPPAPLDEFKVARIFGAASAGPLPAAAVACQVAGERLPPGDEVLPPLQSPGRKQSAPGTLPHLAVGIVLWLVVLVVWVALRRARRRTLVPGQDPTGGAERNQRARAEGPPRGLVEVDSLGAEPTSPAPIDPEPWSPAVSAEMRPPAVAEPAAARPVPESVLPHPAELVPLADADEHGDAVWTIALSANGQLGASGGLDNEVWLWDAGEMDGLRGRRLGAHEAAVSAVALAAGTRSLLSASTDGVMRLWEVATGTEVRRFDTPGGLLAASFSHDGRQALTAGEDGLVRLWDIASGRELTAFRGHAGWVGAVAFSPDGRLAASAGEDRTVRLWDRESGREVCCLEGHEGAVRALVFSCNGRTLATGSEDHSVRLWDVRTGRQLFCLDGHTDWVRAIVFTPDGRHVLSGSDDETICLYDAPGGRQLGRFESLSGSVLSLAVSGDGRRVFAGCDDCSVRLFQLRPKE